jgi:hypothetical protein
MTVTIYPALDTTPHHRCGNGPAAKLSLAMDDILFSDLSALTICDVLRNGVVVHNPLLSALRDTFGGPMRSVADVERIARSYPNNEWLLRFIEPLQSRIYQRHGDGQWNLVRVGPGMF